MQDFVPGVSKNAEPCRLRQWPQPLLSKLSSAPFRLEEGKQLRAKKKKRPADAPLAANMGVSKKQGWAPQIIQFNRVFPYKPSILGYHYFRKHQYCAVSVPRNGIRPTKQSKAIFQSVFCALKTSTRVMMRKAKSSVDSASTWGHYQSAFCTLKEILNHSAPHTLLLPQKHQRQTRVTRILAKL